MSAILFAVCRSWSCVYLFPPNIVQVMPKPVLTLLNFSLPLACSDLGADELENEFVLSKISLLQVMPVPLIRGYFACSYLNNSDYQIPDSK